MEATDLDAIELSPRPDGHHVRIEARVPPAAAFMETFVRMFDVSDLEVITTGVRAGKGFGTDWGHVSYGAGGVDILLSNDSELVPVDAFERFIARLLRASIGAAEAAGAGVTREPWWGRAVKDADAIIARAYPQGL
jgi:hypothetical protein